MAEIAKMDMTGKELLSKHFYQWDVMEPTFCVAYVLKPFNSQLAV